MNGITLNSNSRDGVLSDVEKRKRAGCALPRSFVLALAHLGLVAGETVLEHRGGIHMFVYLF